jgi:hypothetical protein
MNNQRFPEEGMAEMVNVARSEVNEVVVIYLKYSCQMEVVMVDVVHV